MPPPPPSKKWRSQETLTVVFLFLMPPIGLILMWVIANWSTKTKIIIAIMLLLPMIVIGGFLTIGLVSSLGEARKIDRDAARKANMRRIAIAQELYYLENDAYYTFASYPFSIGFVIPETLTDPKTEGAYGWIDNRRNDQKYCAYADLEKDGFFVASHRGTGEITTEPYTLSDCEKFPGFWSY